MLFTLSLNSWSWSLLGPFTKQVSSRRGQYFAPLLAAKASSMEARQAFRGSVQKTQSSRDPEARDTKGAGKTSV
jgi:hypothetical protein